MVDRPSAWLALNEADDGVRVCGGKEHVHFAALLRSLLTAEDALRVLLEVLPQVEEPDTFGVLHAGRAERRRCALLGTAPALLDLVQLVQVLLLPQIVIRARVPT